MGISMDLTLDTMKSEIGGDQQGNNNGENREEGEIVSEFEDIISSDEELTMRQRIEELEAKNSELEKLANISGYYDAYEVDIAKVRYKPRKVVKEKLTNGEYSLPAPNLYPKPSIKRVPISSHRYNDCFAPHNDVPYTTTRRQGYNAHEAAEYPVEKHQSPTRKRRYEKSKRIHGTHKKNRSKSRKKARLDHSISSDEELCSLDRNKLRIALRHDPIGVKLEGNFTGAAKTSAGTRIALADVERHVGELSQTGKSTHEASESDDSESLEIQELRLIALKSAFLRKDRQRKQRKEIEQKKPYSPTDGLQPMFCANEPAIASPQYLLESEPCNSMDISPITSPETVRDGCILNPVDMDIVDSSDSSSPEFLGSKSNWAPIHPHEIPLPKSPHYYPYSASNAGQLISPIPIRTPASTRSIECITLDTDEDEEKVEIVSDENASPEPEDEEVLALRALLLAQKNSPKFNKDLKRVNMPNVPEVVAKAPVLVEQTVPADPLKAILKITQGPSNKTQEILKEAVKRLKNKREEDPLESISSSTTLQDVAKANLSTALLCAQTKHTQFPNDVDYRLMNVRADPILTVGATPKPSDTSTKVPSLPQAIQSVVPPPAKIFKVKENIYTSSGNRPNNIEIVPIRVLQRPIRQSPLTDITETGNVEVNTIPKPIESSAREENRTTNVARSENMAQRIEQPISSSAKAVTAPTPLPAPNKQQTTSVVTKQNQTKKPASRPVTKSAPEGSEKEPKTQTDVPVPSKISPITMKRQRKRSLTAIEALQLKTQILVANGKFVSRNKVVAAKILNKAINHNATAAATKRKLLEKQKALEDARLVKSVNLPNVKPLVINLGAKSESDSDDCCDGDRTSKVQMDCNEFDDVASPISLPMESPRDSPLTISSVTTSLASSEAVNKNKVVEVNHNAVVRLESVASVTPNAGSFEAKLDEFLKVARSKVEISKKDAISQPVKTATVVSQPKLATNSTAVRHLPPSAQLEYRRLIQRMQILEKQKSTRCDTATMAKQSTLKVTINNNIAPNAFSPAKTNAKPLVKVKQKSIAPSNIIKLPIVDTKQNILDKVSQDSSFTLGNVSITRTIYNDNLVTSTPKSELSDIDKDREIFKEIEKDVVVKEEQSHPLEKASIIVATSAVNTSEDLIKMENENNIIKQENENNLVIQELPVKTTKLVEANMTDIVMNDGKVCKDVSGDKDTSTLGDKPLVGVKIVTTAKAVAPIKAVPIIKTVAPTKAVATSKAAALTKTAAPTKAVAPAKAIVPVRAVTPAKAAIPSMSIIAAKTVATGSSKPIATESSKPVAATMLVPGIKVADKKLATEGTYVAAAKPITTSTVAKSIVAAKPGAATKQAVAAKPIAAAKLGAFTKPGAVAKPAVGTIKPIAARPGVTSKPAVGTAKQVAVAQVNTATKPVSGLNVDTKLVPAQSTLPVPSPTSVAVALSAKQTTSDVVSSSITVATSNLTSTTISAVANSTQTSVSTSASISATTSLLALSPKSFVVAIQKVIPASKAAPTSANTSTPVPISTANLRIAKASADKSKPKATLNKLAIAKAKANVKTTLIKKLKGTPVKNLLKPKIGQNISLSAKKLPKLNALQTTLDCENQYRESSCNLLENIRKTIQLVMAAQREKKERLLLEQELDQLRKKVVETEMKIEEKDATMATIYPKISSSHKLIVALKDRTTNLDQLSIDLSKRQGEKRNNSFYVEQKTKVKQLSKSLSIEIKKWKEMKVSNEANVRFAANADAQSIANKCMLNNVTQANSINNKSSSQITTSISTAVSQITNSVNNKLVSGNFNKNDSNSPTSSSSLSSSSSMASKSISMHLSTNNNEALVGDQQPADSKLAECDKLNVQNSVDSNKETNGGEGNCVGKCVEDIIMPNRNPAEQPAKKLYYKICDASNMESDVVGQKSLGHKNEYVSPLECAGEDVGSINPNGILCPYQLMGQCEDKECKYEHLYA